MNNNYSLSLGFESKRLEQYFIIFYINDKKYAVNIHNVKEVINIPGIEIPELTPEGIIGIFNYNGTIIKVIDLCPFLQFETKPFSINNKMIIVCFNEKLCAIHTENIDTIMKFKEEYIQDIPFSSKNSILKQIYKAKDGSSISIIDENTLFELISKENQPKSTIDYTKLFPADEKSKELLDKRAKNQVLTQNIFSYPVNTQTEKQHILFTLDNQNYYMDIRYILEFISLKNLNITKLPYTPDYIAGIISIKGEFLVVINLKKFLYENSKQEIKEKKLIIVETENFNIAFLVDDIKYIRNLEYIQKSKSHSCSTDYIYAEFMENNELYNILNMEKILNDPKLFINSD